VCRSVASTRREPAAVSRASPPPGRATSGSRDGALQPGSWARSTSSTVGANSLRPRCRPRCQSRTRLERFLDSRSLGSSRGMRRPVPGKELERTQGGSMRPQEDQARPGITRGLLRVSKRFGREASTSPQEGAWQRAERAVSRTTGRMGHWTDRRNPDGMRGLSGGKAWMGAARARRRCGHRDRPSPSPLAQPLIARNPTSRTRVLLHPSGGWGQRLDDCSERPRKMLRRWYEQWSQGPQLGADEERRGPHPVAPRDP
jgi:hypothetical protein